jgi:hypothetical protein
LNGGGTMNDFDILISNLNESLLGLWRKYTTETQRAEKIFNDFYDLVITMSFMKILPESRLAMDILHFYNHYRRFRYVNSKEYSQYFSEEKIAKKEFSRLVDQINKL